MKSKSAIVLVLANLVPVFGILFWKWNLTGVLYIYWAENVVIGFFTVLKILTTKRKAKFLWKIIVAMLFAYQFGAVLLIYAGLVLVWPSGNFDMDINDILQSFNGFRWPIFLLFASHGYSFLANYIEGGEREKAGFLKLVLQPYKRTYFTQFLVVCGMFLGVFLKYYFQVEMGMGVVLVLVLFKTIGDLRGHIKEREKFRS